MKRFFPIIVVVLIVSGCAIYQPKPLDLQAGLSHSILHPTVDVSTIPLPKSDTCRFDPDDGLNMTEVAIVAVVNNPELRLARDDVRIAHAQAFEAGLLPNPQLGFGIDIPTDNVAGSSYTALNLGLTYDIRSLMTRSVAKDAGAKKMHQADLTLLWQEWQIIGKARLLFSITLGQERVMKVMEVQRDLLQERFHRSQKALKDAAVTQSVADADMNALADIKGRINDLERKIARTHHEFTSLLGLAIDVDLHLVGDTNVLLIDEAGVNAALDQLAFRRPDLLALRAGYESQDLRYRKAVMEQFPAIGIGIGRACDTSDIHTIGFSLSLDLPLFNRNQGKIALEMATRQRLYDEFENRLSGARNDIAQILTEQQLLKSQMKAVSSEMIQLEASARNAEDAFEVGNIEETDYIALCTALFDKRLERIKLEQTALEQRIALQVLLGRDFQQALDRERNPS